MWSPAPEHPNLQTGEVHVCRASLKANATTLANHKATLTKEEIDRANKFQFAKDRSHFITARAILRNLLGNYLTVDPREIIFHYGSYGKPSLINDNSLHFNLSHSGGMAVVGLVRDYSVGIDLERIKPNIEFEEIANHFFASKEIESLLGLAPGKRPQAFFNCWTRKEAFIKAKGSGLSFPLDKFEVSLRPNEPAKLLATHWDDREKAKWSLFNLEPGEGFAGAVAVNGPVSNVRCWQLED